MKKALPFVLMMLVSLSSFATSNMTNWVDLFDKNPEGKEMATEVPNLTAQSFLEMTPKKYEELTGRKMGVTKALQLKAAQKYMKKQMKKPNGNIEKGLYIVLAIFWLGFVGIGINDDWSGSEWIIALVLYLLCWLPGVIYSLIKMKNYY